MHRVIIYSLSFYLVYSFLGNNPDGMYLIYDEDADKMLVVDKNVFRIHNNNPSFVQKSKMDVSDYAQGVFRYV